MFLTDKPFAVYITTNYTRSVLYTGVTNNLEQRIIEHYLQRGNNKTFAGKYHAYFLLYFECFDNIHVAIDREKQIKDWRRSRKLDLIRRMNSRLEFMNEKLFGKWPPGNNKLHSRNEFEM